MLGALHAALPGAGMRALALASSYDSLIDGLVPVSHWPLREPSGTEFADRRGVATAVGSGNLGSLDLSLVDLDIGGRSLVGDGVSTGLDVPWHPAHGGASGGVALVSQLRTVAAKQQLINRPSGDPGAFTVEVLAGGQLRAYRVDGSGALRSLLGSAGDVAPGEACHIALTWGAAGLKLYRNGVVVASEAIYDWTCSATSGLHFFQWETGVDRGDGLLGHVVFFASQPSDEQMAYLAVPVSAAVAADIDAGAVEEGASASINLRVPGAHYKEPIAAVVDSQPGLGSAVANGQDIEFTAGETAGADSFTYHFVSATGAIAAPKTISLTVTEAVTEYVTTPEAHGLTDPDDPAAVRAAFAAAIADASANAQLSGTGRGVVELVPGKTYICMPAGNGSLANQAGAIELTAATPNVEIRTQGKPSIASGSQAILKHPAWAPYDGVHNRAIIAARSAQNCTLGWVELHGNKLSAGADRDARTTWLQQNVVYSQGGNGGLYNIALYGCAGFRMHHVNSHDGVVDALLIRRSTSNGDPFTDFLAEDCEFTLSRRQGVSMESTSNTSATWDDIVFRRCKFNNNGEQTEMRGEAPGSGFDVEPLHGGDRVYGLTIEDCDIVANQGFTMEVGSLKSHALGRGFVYDGSPKCRYHRFINSRFEGNRTTGLMLIVRNNEAPQFEDFEIIDCKHRDNGHEIGSKNYMEFLGFGAGSGIAAFARFLIVNNEFTVDGSSLGGYHFGSTCADEGHLVDIWKGDYDPGVITNGQITITTNQGFPT